MGQRHYDIGNDKLPSVTTILSQTQPKKRKQSWLNGSRKWARMRQKASGINLQKEGQSCIGS